MKQLTHTYRNLKEWRSAVKLSQQDAAKILGISQTYYSRLERGDQPATGKRAKFIRSKTGVPLDILVGAV